MSYRFSAMLHIPGDVREAIGFYERAFGATKGWSTPSAEDMVAQLSVYGAEFWVHPAGEAIGNPSPQPGGTAVRLMLIVDTLMPCLIGPLLPAQLFGPPCKITSTDGGMVQ